MLIIDAQQEQGVLLATREGSYIGRIIVSSVRSNGHVRLGIDVPAGIVVARTGGDEAARLRQFGAAIAPDASLPPPPARSPPPANLVISEWTQKPVGPRGG